MGEALPIIFHLFRKIKVALAEVGKAPDSLDLFARWGIPETRKHSPLWMCVCPAVTRQRFYMYIKSLSFPC